jgi:hypothetical protein
MLQFYFGEMYFTVHLIHSFINHTNGSNAVKHVVITEMLIIHVEDSVFMLNMCVCTRARAHTHTRTHSHGRAEASVHTQIHEDLSRKVLQC